MTEFSISWVTFLIGILMVWMVWIFSTRTRVGQALIIDRTPWTLPQWYRVLIVVGVTLFILVNPVFHLLGAGVMFGLYYVLVVKGFIPFQNISSWENKGREAAVAGSDTVGVKLLTLTCQGKNHGNLISEKKMLDRCLYSFPFIVDSAKTEVQYLDGKYFVSVQLSSAVYTSSLVDYLVKSGFEILQKN